MNFAQCCKSFFHAAHHFVMGEGRPRIVQGLFHLGTKPTVIAVGLFLCLKFRDEGV